MSPGSFIRTPYHQLPITIVLKAVKQKMYRQLHCLECGWPIADITDKTVVAFDGETPIDGFMTNSFGIIELHCQRHQCKQYYKFEIA